MTWYVYRLGHGERYLKLFCSKLGVAVDADDTELKKAYRKQAMKVCLRAIHGLISCLCLSSS